MGCIMLLTVTGIPGPRPPPFPVCAPEVPYLLSAQDESSSSHSKNDPNVVYFKEINVEPSPNDLQNTMQSSHPSSPEQHEAKYEPSENIGLESGLEPDATYAKQETQQATTSQPSAPSPTNDVASAEKQEANPPRENATSQIAPSEKSTSRADGETDKMLSPSGPIEQKAQSGSAKEGTDRQQSRPFYPDDATTNEMHQRLQETQSSNAKKENSDSVEKFLQQQMNDNQKPPTKVHESPAGITYVPPEVPKPLPKKPTLPGPAKLSPELDLITPQKGLSIPWIP